MKILKMITICFIAIQSFGLSAQVNFFKVKDGVKTVLPEGEKLIFQLDNDGKPLGNIIIEVNVQEFRKKHNYDDILVVFGSSNLPISNSLRVSHTFDNDFEKKKYANINTLNFFAFINADFVDQLGNISPTFSKYYISSEDMNKTFEYRIIGRYKTGTEKYWDEKSNSYKIRDLFESTEVIRKVDVTFEENKAITLSRDFAALIYWSNDDHKGTPTLYKITKDLKKCAQELSKLTVGIGPVSKKKYDNLSKAIYDIAVEKEKELKDEKDKAKGLEQFYEWLKISEKLCIEDDKTKSEQLKKLEKSLGGAKNNEQKLSLIMEYINN